MYHERRRTRGVGRGQRQKSTVYGRRARTCSILVRTKTLLLLVFFGGVGVGVGVAGCCFLAALNVVGHIYSYPVRRENISPRCCIVTEYLVLHCACLLRRQHIGRVGCCCAVCVPMPSQGCPSTPTVVSNWLCRARACNTTNALLPLYCIPRSARGRFRFVRQGFTVL